MKPLPKFIVVVHAKSPKQAVEQSRIAFDNGADGIFLINHRIPSHRLITCYELVRLEHPDAFIGLNFLDLTAWRSIEAMPEGCDALWMDNPEVHPDIPLTNAYQIAKFSFDKGAGTKWRTFASVAFKYQMHDPKPEWSAMRACELFDVVVTSGSATGQPPEVDKIRAMKEEMAFATPLALASGVSAENVASYKPYISCFMVATSISNDDDTLNPDKVHNLADLIKN